MPLHVPVVKPAAFESSAIEPARVAGDITLLQENLFRVPRRNEGENLPGKSDTEVHSKSTEVTAPPTPNLDELASQLKHLRSGKDLYEFYIAHRYALPLYYGANSGTAIAQITQLGIRVDPSKVQEEFGVTAAERATPTLANHLFRQRVLAAIAHELRHAKLADDVKRIVGMDYPVAYREHEAIATGREARVALELREIAKRNGWLDPYSPAYMARFKSNFLEVYQESGARGFLADYQHLFSVREMPLAQFRRMVALHASVMEDEGAGADLQHLWNRIKDRVVGPEGGDSADSSRYRVALSRSKRDLLRSYTEIIEQRDFPARYRRWQDKLTADLLNP